MLHLCSAFLTGVHCDSVLSKTQVVLKAIKHPPGRQTPSAQMGLERCYTLAQ